jgi:hypothetical protein
MLSQSFSWFSKIFSSKAYGETTDNEVGKPGFLKYTSQFVRDVDRILENTSGYCASIYDQFGTTVYNNRSAPCVGRH